MSNPKFLLSLIVALGVPLLCLRAQSPAEMEARLRKPETTKTDRMTLYHELAKKYLSSNPSKAATYAYNASNLATELGEKRIEAEALYLSGQASLAARRPTDAAERFEAAWQSGRNYGLTSVVVGSLEQLRGMAERKNNLSDALRWSVEEINYLKKAAGAGGATGNPRQEARLADLQSENQRLRTRLQELTGQSEAYASRFTETEARLQQVQEQTQEVLTQKEEELSVISQEKQQLDSVARFKSSLVDNLTKEQLATRFIQEQQEKELQEKKAALAEAELARQESEALRNILALVVGFSLVIALLFYLRFRAKKRTANQLMRSKAQIEAEQERSNKLLLNILPAAIAEELKVKSKVAARKYDQASVMFVDFTGFTNLSERLTPEQLVQELDHCFSNFDRIIGKYRIEKIKTIGDAYLCASGLSDHNDNPADIIRAGLEMQDFLLELKAIRQSQGLPFFEARIGIHTGPVVAGVVGQTKFAYDIWGDTVNLAARMEQSCDPGRVNVSDDAYRLAQYAFEWQHRGKVAAKNKGMLDMYYAVGLKQY
ncbi:MAG: adenylate/guanylate cyclase domain-containing protein [Saprospiraceae bacterium]|nr:adenylate/guanylate cyclase domain-containing protein [Saprospiraceae bacterium]